MGTNLWLSKNDEKPLNTIVTRFPNARTNSNNVGFKSLTTTVCALLLFTLDAGMLARSQYSGGPATGHLDTGFPWFPCVYKQMAPKTPRCHYMLLM